MGEPMKLRQAELMEILSQAGPKGKEIANAIKNRGPVELHIHINGPLMIGSEICLSAIRRLLADQALHRNNKS